MFKLSWDKACAMQEIAMRESKAIRKELLAAKKKADREEKRGAPPDVIATLRDQIAALEARLARVEAVISLNQKALARMARGSLEKVLEHLVRRGLLRVAGMDKMGRMVCVATDAGASRT